MKVFPSLEQAKELCSQRSYRNIPVSCEIYADSMTPIQAMRILKHVSHHCYMLESVEDSKKWGRYTFLGFDPKLEITCQNGVMTVKNGTVITEETTNPGKFIRKVIEENNSQIGRAHV